MAAANIGRLEADFDAVDLLQATDDFPGIRVDAYGNIHTVNVDHRMEAAFGEDIDHHSQGEGIVE